MIVLKILQFASESISNFLVTLILLSTFAWSISNIRLINVDITRDIINTNKLNEKEEDTE